MSRQDDRFFNVFSAVLGILIAITIGVFVFARILGGDMVETQTASDPQLQQEVVGRIRPFGQVAVAGKDNAALAIAPPPGAAAQPAAAAMPANGEETYNAVCAVCHGAGIGGAPKVGDKAAWAPRIAQGMDTLNKHAVEGFTGPAGFMPAKGGRADLPDDLVMQDRGLHGRARAEALPADDPAGAGRRPLRLRDGTSGALPSARAGTTLRPVRARPHARAGPGSLDCRPRTPPVIRRFFTC